MDRDKFERFIALLIKKEALPLLGVVPDNRDRTLETGNGMTKQAFLERMRELKDAGAVFAVHGRYHLYTTKRGGLFPLNRKSEFAGLPREKQKQMLAEGREALQKDGMDTDIFMAPSHSYDGATLKALRETGFRYVTDGFGKSPYIREGLVFLPVAMRRDAALHSTAPGTVTVVVHTNTLSESDFRYYERAMEEAALIPYRTLLAQKPAKRGAAGHFAEYLTAYAKRTAVRWRGRGRNAG